MFGFGDVLTFGLFLFFSNIAFLRSWTFYLCLELETQADLVSAAVHVLPIEQAGEGELHSWEGGRGSTRLCVE